jgi:hypothetical protein
MAAKAVKEAEKPVREAVPRISITITPTIRKHMRIAAAHADLEVGDWARRVLLMAAAKATGVDVEELEEDD